MERSVREQSLHLKKAQKHKEAQETQKIEPNSFVLLVLLCG
jgi:hypothetical protein